MALTPFILLVAGGMLAGVGASRAGQLAWKFLRLVGVLVGLTAVSVIAWSLVGPGRSETSLLPDSTLDRVSLGLTALLALGAFSLLTLAPIADRIETAVRWVCAVAAAGGIAAGCTWWLAGDPLPATSGWLRGVACLGNVLSAWLMGTVTLSWLLGHAYLTATKMTIDPLRRLSKLICVAIALRILFVLILMGSAYLFGGEAVVVRMGREWLILSLRIGVGLVAVGVFSYMILDCVRLRSTQSATGLLYFTSVLVYIGELSSQYLTGRLGWPV